MKASTFFACLAGVLAINGNGIAQVETKPTSPAPAAAVRGKVDLNTADIPTLEALPEIGTDFANAVVSGRPYKSVDDLSRAVKLPSERMASLRTKVFVSPPPPTASTPRDPRNNAPSKASPINEAKATPAQEVTERYDRAKNKTAPTSK